MATLGNVAKIGVRALVLVANLGCQSIAWAEYRGTVDQQAACTPDAFRLCGNYIPDATRVEMCLRQNKPNLSAACRSVFDRNTGSVASQR